VTTSSAGSSGDPVGVPSLRVLLLCETLPGGASTIADHVGAFTEGSRHRVLRLNPRPGRHLHEIDLDAFDAVVLHYSLYTLLDSYLPRRFRERLRRFRGLKVQFIQDDYRQVDAFARLMADLGIDLLYTLVPERAVAQVWRRHPQLDRVEIHTTLAGYAPDRLLRIETLPIRERALDVAYRGRMLPYWLGALGQEKVTIARGFLERARASGLRCDIGWREEDRIYGHDWERFLASARAVLGTESGASITDFDGTLQTRVDAYVALHPEASFEEVSRKILQPYEGNVMMNIISPRMFEAIALRTALVLFPGEYSGVLEPGRHYVPLEKDFSNFDEVAARIRDDVSLQEMVDRTHAEILESGRYSYRSFIASVDAEMGRAWQGLSDERRAAVAGRPARALAWWRVRARVARARLLDPAGWPGRWLFRLLGRLGPILTLLVGSPRQLARRTRLTAACLRHPRGRRLLAAVLRDGARLPRAECVPVVLQLGGLATLRRGQPQEVRIRLVDRTVSVRPAGGSWDRLPAHGGEGRAALAHALRRGRVDQIEWASPDALARTSDRVMLALPAPLMRWYADELADLLLGADEGGAEAGRRVARGET
jgi:hypothetical protein